VHLAQSARVKASVRIWGLDSALQNDLSGLGKINCIVCCVTYLVCRLASSVAKQDDEIFSVVYSLSVHHTKIRADHVLLCIHSLLTTRYGPNIFYYVLTLCSPYQDTDCPCSAVYSLSAHHNKIRTEHFLLCTHSLFTIPRYGLPNCIIIATCSSKNSSSPVNRMARVLRNCSMLPPCGI